MVQIKLYNSNIGIFIQRDSILGSYTYAQDYLGWRINGNVLPTPIRNHFFLRMEFAIDSVEKRIPKSKLHTGYQLVNPALASDQIPEYLSLAEVNLYTDDDGDKCWSNYSGLRSLYTQTYEDLPEQWEHVAFNVEVLEQLSIVNYQEPMKLNVTLHSHNSPWDNNQTTEVDLLSITEFSDIDKMLTPEFLLHERPCTLPSSVVYRIIRNYVKSNINNAHARVTSDYDFCFTVKKRITVKPYNVSREQYTSRSKSYRPPKFVNTTVSEKIVEVFEMTDDKHFYKGYTPIAAWTASSLSELKYLMENYLADLMMEINCPVSECEHCSGTGHITISKIGTNKRN